MSREFEAPHIDTIRACAEVPNAPYLYSASSKFVAETLASLGFEKSKESQLDGNYYLQDQYATYVKIKHGNSPYKLLITTHLDHPFLVLDGKGGGQPVGSIEMSQLMEQKGEVPIKVYTNSGEFQGVENVQGYSELRGKGKVTVTKSIDYPKNSHGIWDIEPVDIRNGVLYMRNADNAINTAVMLSLIGQLASSPPYGTDVEFVFCNLEEVAQISATAIGLRGRTPYSEIDKNTFILVLESANIETRHEDNTALEQIRLQPASYDRGLVLRLNDRDVVYGQQIDQENLLEHALLDALNATGTTYQQTVLSGVCDATAFTLFTDTAHIASLTIPTRYKHNVDESGRLVHEQLLLRDVDGSSYTINKLIQLVARGDIRHRNDAISNELKRSSLSATSGKLKLLKDARLGALTWSESRLRYGVLYPENKVQSVDFLIDKIQSRFH